MSAKFSVKQASPSAVKLLMQQLRMPRFIAATLVSRGITTVGAAKHFLTPSLERDWVNPYEIDGISDVADVLQAAIKQQSHIMVFGDFDVDGISATCVLVRALRVLGAAKITPFIPHRNIEGYGITDAAIERVLQTPPDVLVTVDCGISSREEIVTLQKHGIICAVTDHHEPSGLVPEVPVANPKLKPESTSAILAGVGVALKLVQVLGARFGKPHLWREYIDFATLGTVADLMPMKGENRALVSEGIKKINDEPRPAIAALLKTSGYDSKTTTASNLSFSLSPRINAAGRMGDSMLALNLMLCDDPAQCEELAKQIEQLNDLRRAKEAELSEIASAQAEQVYTPETRVLVLAGEGWHEGVKGIVANRISGKYGVPSLLFTIEDGMACGSGRSVGNVNLFEAVDGCKEILTRYGGHQSAVGVTLPAEKLPQFTQMLGSYMSRLSESDFHPPVVIDGFVNLGELTLPNVVQLQALEPFGQENKEPVYAAKNVTVATSRAVGSSKNHLSCILSNGVSELSAIKFNCENIDELLQTHCVVNATFKLEIDEWRGCKNVKAMLKTIEPARACEGLLACLNPSDVAFMQGLYDACAEGESTVAGQSGNVQENSSEGSATDARKKWEVSAQQNPTELESEIVSAFIGQGKLHSTQRRILDALAANKSVLGVMVTGRGKSLTFQVHATLLALLRKQASLFVYPLRALIADQAHHLQEALGRFGISVCVLTGESTSDERKRAFEGLAVGSVDIALTTPEFLFWHADEFAASGRVGFVVIDEAHHIGLARAGQRQAYANIGGSIQRLGSPKVLALTATANDECLAAIKRELCIDECIYDTTNRPNLHLNDARSVISRDNFLASLVATGDKTVVFVNSREQSVSVARNLRRQVPQVACLIGFYNAGLNRAERKRIETLFRCGKLQVLVTTSAFGEGVDIPDIKHVVLYHMPFNEIEFNQMAGRAGRNGQDAYIHLLFNKRDSSINDNLLFGTTPPHDKMAQIYRGLRNMQNKSGADVFKATDAALAQNFSTAFSQLNEAAISCAIAVFSELGLIDATYTFDGEAQVRCIHVNSPSRKVELTNSVRYLEGLAEIDTFHEFCNWAIKSTTDVLERRISNPILPTEAFQSESE